MGYRHVCECASLSRVNPVDRDVATQAFVGILFVGFPGTTVLIGAPVWAGTWPALLQGELDPLFSVLWGALFLGIAAAPGYLKAAFDPEGLARASGAELTWVRISLIAAVLASLVTTACSVFFAWPIGVFPLGTLALCGALTHRIGRPLRRTTSNSD